MLRLFATTSANWSKTAGTMRICLPLKIGRRSTSVWGRLWQDMKKPFWAVQYLSECPDLYSELLLPNFEELYRVYNNPNTYQSQHKEEIEIVSRHRQLSESLLEGSITSLSGKRKEVQVKWRLSMQKNVVTLEVSGADYLLAVLFARYVTPECCMYEVKA